MMAGEDRRLFQVSDGGRRPVQGDGERVSGGETLAGRTVASSASSVAVEKTKDGAAMSVAGADGRLTTASESMLSQFAGGEFRFGDIWVEFESMVIDRGRGGCG